MRREFTYSTKDHKSFKFCWQDYEDYGSDLTDGLAIYTPQAMAEAIRRFMAMQDEQIKLFADEASRIKVRLDSTYSNYDCEIYDPWEFLGYMAANDNMPVLPSQCQLADFLSQEVAIC